MSNGKHNMYTMLMNKNYNELKTLRETFGEFEEYIDSMGHKRRRATIQYGRARERHNNYFTQLQHNKNALMSIPVSDKEYESGMKTTIGPERFKEQSDGSGLKEETIDFLMKKALSSIGAKERTYEDMLIDGMKEKEIF